MFQDCDSEDDVEVIIIDRYRSHVGNDAPVNQRVAFDSRIQIHADDFSALPPEIVYIPLSRAATKVKNTITLLDVIGEYGQELPNQIAGLVGGVETVLPPF
ncbi:MAG: hypothetical protein A2V70_11550 [Planctomycetes bacterium RBG_13_63_9]|nr:MAG: hypothetical protein A2V70_11550 [Planctomycetes bacterium RBG_13_63_9]